jgi:hypothetical protein
MIDRGLILATGYKPTSAAYYANKYALEYTCTCLAHYFLENDQILKQVPSFKEKHDKIRASMKFVYAALKGRNLYKSPLGKDKHDITCPWIHEQTNGIDGGTAYFEPDDNYPLGGFKCQHGHCCERHIRDLLHILYIDIKLARMKPIIHIVKGEIHLIVDIAERELAATQKFYQQGVLSFQFISRPN